MKEFRGYFEFPSQAFDFTFLNSINDYIKFDELQDVLDINDKEIESIMLEFTNTYPSNPIEITLTFKDNTPPDVTYTNVGNINQDLDTVLFGGDIVGMGRISTNITDSGTLNALKNCFNYDKNVIFLFRLNSEKNVVTKNLIWKKTLSVSFNNPIKVRDMLLNVKLGVNDMDFNYVYISSLHRFYFVNDMLLTNDYAQLTLHEDILSSWDELIRSQTAFVERNQYTIDSDKVDDLVSYDYDKYIDVTVLTDNLTLFPIRNYVQYLDTKCIVISLVGVN